MSGGHFDYDDSKIFDWAKQVETDGNPLFAELLRSIGDLLHEYDWWQSGDTGREDWLVAWKEWQKKWMKGDLKELTLDILRMEIKRMVVESLGLERDEEYDRIVERIRGW